MGRVKNDAKFHIPNVFKQVFQSANGKFFYLEKQEFKRKLTVNTGIQTAEDIYELLHKITCENPEFTEEEVIEESIYEIFLN